METVGCTEMSEKHFLFLKKKQNLQVWNRHRLQMLQALTRRNKQQEMNQM